MGLLDEAVDIKDLGQRNLWVIYGKSGSGKTKVLSTFPKPLLYLQIGDDGSNTIIDAEDVKAIRVKDSSHLKGLLQEARLDKKYATVACDTFSLFTNEWIDANAIQKKKRMTQQMWGDLKSDTEEIIKLAHILALKKIVVLTCHEGADAFEGMEDEITPDIRPSVTKGARTYLEAMANYGIHTTILEKQNDNGKTLYRYAVHLASNPYYWVKTQKPANIKLPKLVYNPTYDKIMNLLEEK
jgi:hypothetical protein